MKIPLKQRILSFFSVQRIKVEKISNYPHGANRIQRRKKVTTKHTFGGVFFVGSLSLAYGAFSLFFGPVPNNPIALHSNDTSSMELNVVEGLPLPNPVLHVKIPDAVKAIYMSSCVAATSDFRDRVINIANTTEINSIVIDIKDNTGMISYPSKKSELLQVQNSGSCRINDIRGLIAMLHESNIYVIGRIAVFQDPYFVKIHPELAVRKASNMTIWKDRNGAEWLDAGSHIVWDYAMLIARDAYSEGFDEINFDYIRYPSDGDLQDISFPVSGTSTKAEVIKGFYSYVNNEMKTSGITTSADVFGMTTTSSDDLNIGQLLESAVLNFDYVAPMVYPSHYPKGFNDWSNPNAHPYDLIKFVMTKGVEKTLMASTTPLKLRPWLQDFTMGSPKYGKKEVEQQIQATYDSGLTSWMLWDPSNKYAGGALLRE